MQATRKSPKKDSKSKGVSKAASRAQGKPKVKAGIKNRRPGDMERRYRDLFDNMVNAVAVYRVENGGRDFIFSEVNQAVERLEQVNREALIGRNVRDVFPGVEQFGLLDVFRKVYRTGKSQHYPISFYEDGRITGWRENYVYRLASGEVVAVYSDETEKKQAEMELLNREQVLDAINAIFRVALQCDTEVDLAQTCLKVAQSLTGSQFGFIGEVNPAGQFDTIAISNPGWEACRIPASDATLLIKDMPLRGIWARVVKSGQALIANDPANHPDSAGLPEGHPPLESFLGVPLKEGERTFGMMALGNKPLGYSPDDAKAAETLSIAIVETLKAKRFEKTLSRQAKEIMDLSTPVIQIWAGVVVVPLIGILDSARTEGFMERFLNRIVETRSKVAMVDITGVPTIDTQTAQHLIEAINAARLLGTQVILTGVRPAIAQTLVTLGIDLAGIETRASLTAGFQLALGILNLAVTPTP